MNTSIRRTWRLRTVLALIAALTLQGGIVAVASSPAWADGTVSVAVQGRGDVSGDGIDCNETGGPDCSQFYSDVTEQICDPELKPPCHTETYPPTVEFTAADRSGTGFGFSHWSGCDSVSGVGDRTCHLTVTSSTTVTAHFVDRMAPVVGGLKPSGGFASRTIWLSAQASDNVGVTAVEFRVRGVLVGTLTEAPYSMSYDTTTIPDGTATFKATAKDAAGNVSAAGHLSPPDTTNFTIDNTPPRLEIGSGPDGQTFGPGTTQSWTFAASDRTLALVLCSVQPTGTAPRFGACSGGANSHSVTNRPGGRYDFIVRARDSQGYESQLLRSFVIDATPPAITQRRPAQGASITDRTPVISAVVKDMRTTTLTGTMTNSGIKMYVDGVSRAFTFNATTGKVSWQSTRLSRAVHTVKIVSTDAVGNVTESQWTFTVRRP